jgi:hypothetical protein
MLPVPPILMRWLAPFAAFFTRPTWDRVLVLVAGTVLAPGRRTVTAALSVLRRRDEADFARFHDVLNRAQWSGRSLARVLLRWLVAVFVADGPVVVGIDETIERRWGPKISARGIYRDPVRSSRGHFVKASGLRWVSVMLLAPIPWAERIWGLPFLTALAPSERHARQAGATSLWPTGAVSCCFWPAVGCPAAGLLPWPTPPMPSSSCSPPCATG